MKQIFGYTAPEINEGEPYVKFFQVFEVGNEYQVTVRSGLGLTTSVMVPAHIMDDLASKLKV